jgi:hypothetical protein
MIPKSGYRFSEKIMLNKNALTRGKCENEGRLVKAVFDGDAEARL